MENSFGSVVSSAKSLLILLSNSPSLDEVAASLSLSLVLPQDSSVSCSSPMLVEFNRLIGVDRIRKDLGNKNLTVKFANYKAESIEKVSYDIENGEFKLTVVPKVGMTAPKQDQVEVSYAGISADLIVLIGGQSKDHFQALSQKELQDVKTVHIGTKAFEGQNILEFARPSAAVSEVMAHLLKESGLINEFDPDTATNLLAGIEDGSQSFTHPYVNADTFMLLADLMKSGGKRLNMGQISRDQFPVGSIPGEMFQPKSNEEIGAIEGVELENAPQSWFEKPQIYKGTSVS